MTRLLRGSNMYDLINAIVIILIFACWTLIIGKIVISRYAPVKTVKAKIVDKYKSDIVPKYYGTFKQERYMVVFETKYKYKRLSFDVSEFSYGNYKINQKGTLKYRGKKIISFQ